jgi:sterol desaturase/sphingolipid hydroxylase (fatty acid hydroxylase superfamily)
MRSPTVLSLAIGLLVLSALFWLLERRQARCGGPRRTRADTRVDLAYWFFTPLVTRALTQAAVAIAFVVIAIWRGLSLAELRTVVATRQTWATALPPWVQIPLILLLADLLAYWSHRLFHAWFHRWHHTTEEEPIRTAWVRGCGSASVRKCASARVRRCGFDCRLPIRFRLPILDCRFSM